MRMDYTIPLASGIKPVKRARYAERQPHEDKVTLRVNRRFMMAVYEDCLEDTFATWQRKGFRRGRVPNSWRPKVMEEVREFVCSQIAHYAFDQVQSRVDPQPMTPPHFRWTWWEPGKDFIVRVTYLIQPHIPDPMQMFNLEIPLEDNLFELPGKVTAPSVPDAQPAAPDFNPPDPLESLRNAPGVPEEMKSMFPQPHVRPSRPEPGFADPARVERNPGPVFPTASQAVGEGFTPSRHQDRDDLNSPPSLLPLPPQPAAQPTPASTGHPGIQSNLKGSTVPPTRNRSEVNQNDHTA